MTAVRVVDIATARPWPIDRRRGTAGMALFIASEALLFGMLFFSYAYLAHGRSRWAVPPPRLAMPFVMLAVLLTSSGVLAWAERRVRGGYDNGARGAVAVTAALGVTFLALQAREYASRLQEMTPATNAYGSIFYAITGVHGLHVALGVCMLGYVLLLPDISEGRTPPHRPLRNAAMYWHFVDVVWLVIVIVLYVAPRVRP